MLQDEQVHKMTSILLKMVEVVILSENIVVILSVAQLVTTEIIHVFNGTTPEIQHNEDLSPNFFKQKRKISCAFLKLCSDLL